MFSIGMTSFPSYATFSLCRVIKTTCMDAFMYGCVVACPLVWHSLDEAFFMISTSMLKGRTHGCINRFGLRAPIIVLAAVLDISFCCLTPCNVVVLVVATLSAGTTKSTHSCCVGWQDSTKALYCCTTG